jgi:signal transduction histidine kinase
MTSLSTSLSNLAEDRSKTWLSWILRALAAAFVTATFASNLVITVADGFRTDLLASGIGILLYGVLLWIIAPGQAGNPVSWVLATFVLGLTAIGVVEALVAVQWPSVLLPLDGETIPAELLGSVGAISSWAESLSAVGLFGLLTFGFLLFPDGHLPSPRWRWLAYFCALGVAFLGATVSPLLEMESVSFAAAPFVWFGPLLCLVSLVMRFRRADVSTRSQIKWIVWGGAMLVPMVFISLMFESPLAFTLGVFVFGASYAIGITKYRLYDIDVVISRTLVLGVLAAFITLTYALIVVGVGQLIGSGSDDLLLPVAATAVVAVAFEPVRQRAQRWANRVAFGRRATPYEVLSDLTVRLAASEEGQGVLMRMARLIHDGTGALRAVVWLGSPGQMRAAATWPGEAAGEATPDLDHDDVFPVVHDGEVVGALEVTAARGSVLSHQERELISDVAGSAGLVLGYQRLNDSLARKVEEVRESRKRLLGASDEQRLRMERELHQGAERLIESLNTDLRAASQASTGSGESAKLTQLLESLAEESRLALEELRGLARGIYPPILVSDGLVPAVRSLVNGAPVEVHFSHDGVSRHPVDIEAAIYFDISEAVTNAVKHASGPIRVDLNGSENEIAFSVSDSGPGFDLASANGGSGLQNLRDRIDAVGGTIEIDSSEAGTTVSGVVPLGVVPV